MMVLKKSEKLLIFILQMYQQLWQMHILPQTEARRKEFDKIALDLELVDISVNTVVAYE